MSELEKVQSDARLYDDNGEELLQAAQMAQRVNLIPGQIGGSNEPGNRIRIMWGQDMLRDVLDGRYRTVVCAVNDADNTSGIIGQLVNLVPTSQWTVQGVTSYAKTYQSITGVHGSPEHEPYVLKYDLDSIEIFALLRPKDRTHFTMDELRRGFQTITRMLRARQERQPACSVSFLGARTNKVLDEDGREPSFEKVLRMQYEAGFRGDVYPSFKMWDFVHVGVFPTYPFPEGFDRMRQGSS